jgi:hypothetical protein
VDVNDLERSANPYYNHGCFESVVCLVRKVERRMTFFGKTVNKVARQHHLQQVKSPTEGSLDELSDKIKMIEMNLHVVKIINFRFILVYFPLLFTLSMFQIFCYFNLCVLNKRIEINTPM